MGDEQSIYETANSSLDIAAMIYYYTELRSEAKSKMFQDFVTNEKMEWKQLGVIYNAMELVKSKRALVEGRNVAPEESRPAREAVAVIKEYRDSLEQLDRLSQQLGLNESDVDVLKMYFDILEPQKKLTGVLSDLIRYDHLIDPKFRLLYGGTQWNRENVLSMVESDSSYRVHKIDDDFAFTSFGGLNAALSSALFAEVVWAIVVSDKKKTITVTFRGSVANLRDWTANFDFPMVDFELPGFTTIKKDTKQTFGKVHKGFYEYLFGKTKEGANESTKSKAEEIMGILMGDFFSKPEFQDYRLEVTGHSLGGALSTMFAFRAAALGDFDNIAMTVTNVSFASPYVGDDGFRESFIKLERKRKIRHLRISNNEDLVVYVPPVSFDLPPKPFKHVGMNIRLYEKSLGAPNYRRFYPKQRRGTLEGIRNAINSNLFLGLNVTGIRNHLLPEYHKRLNREETKEELQKLSLSGLYGNEDVTGWGLYGKLSEGNGGKRNTPQHETPQRDAVVVVS